LNDASALYRLSVWTYSLMPNHVHIIGVPEREDSLARMMKESHGSYSSYFNKKYGLVGHSWQGRFKSIPMEESHSWNAVRYVELNPVRAGLVKRAEDYLWSGAAGHCGLRDDSLLSKDCPLIKEITNWSEWLTLDSPIGFHELIRQHTRTGRPLGSNEFIASLESQTGRKLLPQKRGPRLKANPGDEQSINSSPSVGNLFR
jgi:putative transposase